MFVYAFQLGLKRLGHFKTKSGFEMAMLIIWPILKWPIGHWPFETEIFLKRPGTKR